VREDFVMNKILGLAALLAMLLTLYASAAFANASVPAHPGTPIKGIMQTVNTVLAAMTAHSPSALGGAYTNDAVIIDDQAPYQWSGKNAGIDWLTTVTTYGKLSAARFHAVGDPALLQWSSHAAYVIVSGSLDGVGARQLHQAGSLEFSLREAGGTWKITGQFWARNLPAGYFTSSGSVSE
jgi:hypothetical protein